ncbi:hypothetical protein AALO_G00032400 [Alosa alosa]|uniref:Uncharacterized protein n=1 Tax=Alosa alosa TaxID=278164 RepID=A0AAV6HCF4_9TELE|nr:hypothetical protein AALO_G00032400 [Alosa alosa]
MAKTMWSSNKTTSAHPQPVLLLISHNAPCATPTLCESARNSCTLAVEITSWPYSQLVLLIDLLQSQLPIAFLHN